MPFIFVSSIQFFESILHKFIKMPTVYKHNFFTEGSLDEINELYEDCGVKDSESRELSGDSAYCVNEALLSTKPFVNTLD